MNLRQNQKGFTIVELLIVVVVIAILAAISIVAYTGITNRANNSASAEAANSAKSVAAAFQGSQGKYPINKTEFVNGYATTGGVAADAIAKLPSDITFLQPTAATAAAAATSLNASSNAKEIVVFAYGSPAVGMIIYHKDFTSTTPKSMTVGDATGALSIVPNS